MTYRAGFMLDSASRSAAGSGINHDSSWGSAGAFVLGNMDRQRPHSRFAKCEWMYRRWRSQAAGSQSVDHLQRELNLSRRSGGLADPSEPRPEHRVRRQGEIDDIEQVEELTAKLEGH